MSLSSNMGVLQTTVAEIVTIKEHQREQKYYSLIRTGLIT